MKGASYMEVTIKQIQKRINDCMNEVAMLRESLSEACDRRDSSDRGGVERYPDNDVHSIELLPFRVVLLHIGIHNSDVVSDNDFETLIEAQDYIREYDGIKDIVPVIIRF